MNNRDNKTFKNTKPIIITKVFLKATLKALFIFRLLTKNLHKLYSKPEHDKQFPKMFIYIFEWSNTFTDGTD